MALSVIRLSRIVCLTSIFTREVIDMPNSAAKALSSFFVVGSVLIVNNTLLIIHTLYSHRMCMSSVKKIVKKVDKMYILY